ncbi:MAG: DegV family protein [Christensenellales bacterium]
MVKISSDSTCDLSKEILEKYDITMIPLSILVGEDEKVYKDGVDITPQEIFRLVDEEGKTSQTAAVNTFEYEQAFAKMLQTHEAVIHICISAAFSSCYENACRAAQNFKNVHIIDSRNLSTGSGHIVYDAALMAGEGMEPDEICRALQETIPKVDASFVIDRLDYLRRGGRCSALTAQGAKLLQLKPCIEVVNGEMTVGKKYRGKLEKCLAHYVRDRLKDEQHTIDKSRVFITHSPGDPSLAALVCKEIEKHIHFEEVVITDAGCTISNHCGPNTLGILYKRTHEKGA